MTVDAFPTEYHRVLSGSHVMTCRGEFWREGAKLADVSFIGGSVAGDRNAAVRRTLQARIDPAFVPKDVWDVVTPYGTYIKVYRGIRFPTGTVEEYDVFYGRIDAIDMTLGGLEIRGSDLTADVRDARFEQPRASDRGLYITEQITTLIQEVFPGAVVNHNVASTERVSVVVWDRERGEALDNLSTAIAGEWYAGPDGQFYVGPGPVVNAPIDPVWVLDAGSSGVLVSSDSRLERQNIYNAVVVNGEPADKPPVTAVARDENPESVLRWGGPFGKVPRFYSSQFIYTQAQAQKTADKLLQSEITATRFVNVVTIPNPKLMLSDPVYVTGSGDAFDGHYYVSSFDLPLAPEDPMQVAVYASLYSTPPEEGVRVDARRGVGG